MIRKTFVMNCKEGFHLRPAQVLTEKSVQFDSDITVKKSESEEADAKSILGLMSLGIETGESVEVEVSGPDENEAMDMVEQLFKSNFNES
ncbi:MAG TPA: HPr family phosphocarrier protein [Caproiciproducens sp.]|nr:HPr family phosphocarrier protein [Caproiciproducens sp.]